MQALQKSPKTGILTCHKIKILKKFSLLLKVLQKLEFETILEGKEFWPIIKEQRLFPPDIEPNTERTNHFNHYQ